MRNSSVFLFAVCLFFIVSCSSSEQVHNASELQPGSSLSELTIQEVRSNEEGFSVTFKDTILLEGEVINSPLGDYGVKNQLLTEKIKVNDHLIDLELEDVLYFRNYQEMPKYFAELMFEQSPDGKVLSGKHSVKVKVSGIEINTDARDLVSGEVIEVISVDGQEAEVHVSEQKAEADQVPTKNELESELWKRIDNLSKSDAAPENGLFYTNDIRDFHFYQANNEFRSFVDDILANGYGIEQAEGAYYLFEEEPVNYTDREMETEEILKFEDLEEGGIIDGLTIVKHELVPNDYFILELSDSFFTSGKLYFDEMWYELTFQADEGTPLNKEIEVAGIPIKLMSYVKFNNKDEVRAALGSERVKRIEAGEPLPVTMVVKNYSLQGAFESEYGTSFDFVSFED